MSIRVIANEDVLGAYSDLQAHSCRQSRELAKLNTAHRRAKRELDKLENENAELRDVARKMLRDFVNCDIELRRHGKTFLPERYVARLSGLGVEI